MSKKIGFFLGSLLLLFIIWGIISQIISSLKSGDRLKEATDRLHSLEVKNKELKEKLEDVKKPEFIETQARDKLGLVKEGETLIIISQKKLDEVLGLSKKIEEIRFPNWQGWLRLFFK